MSVDRQRQWPDPPNDLIRKKRIIVGTIDPKEYKGKIVIIKCDFVVSNEDKERIVEQVGTVFDTAKKVLFVSDEIEIDFA